ncbi:glutamyl-tRNA(Gln) amidotransferase subunit C, mitochondrial [Elysia marginata]|uniref:Glutamyl-tRNA(Gln) amidotransferase subunit C, mitochondrial n=1 Tax=Elysia marginata TaxID=1093978 RepID=A0AAV4GWC6_9GAST|nr:glutamyl-tRNA(Gln) amidotransferase subunit C, mitochondrial [Elysia marginata]
MLRVICNRLRLARKHSTGIDLILKNHAKNCRSLISFSSKVPDKPTWDPVDHDKLPKVPEIDLALVEQLERISLVEFNNEAGLLRLQEAVKLANQMHLVDTDGVEPLDSVLEDRECYLRSDDVTDGNCVEDVMSNASKVEEQYFVAPPVSMGSKGTVLQRNGVTESHRGKCHSLPEVNNTLFNESSSADATPLPADSSQVHLFPSCHSIVNVLTRSSLRCF